MGCPLGWGLRPGRHQVQLVPGRPGDVPRWSTPPPPAWPSRSPGSRCAVPA